MKNTILIFVLVFIVPSFSQAQEGKGKSFEIPLGADLAFDKVVDLGLREDFFISNLDKKANFLQLIKLSVKTKKGLVSDGERLTYNFVIREKDESTSVVFLQIKIEDSLYKNYVSYYVDKGITSDSSYYDPIIEKLNQIFQSK